MNHSRSFNLVIGLILCVLGAVLVLLPENIYDLILDLALFVCFFNTLYQLWQYISKKDISDLLFGLLSLSFVVILSRWQSLPEWFIRVTFGVYLICSAIVTGIQLVLDLEDSFLSRLTGLLFLTVVYGWLGISLLFSPDVDTALLMQLFGIYFVIMGFRFFMDALPGGGRNYRWKRGRRIMLPPALSAILPDWFLKQINSSMKKGEPVILREQKTSAVPQLQVMVHVGPKGFQKIGHISFAYKGVVYSYGNYDSDSFRLNGTIGDGVFFNMAVEDYIPNMMQVENNTIFEYGILLDKEQEKAVEKELHALRDNAYRWYTRIERADGYDQFSRFEMDYPSRLHFRSGAKMYKFKSGKFRTYWALGDNCAAFTDVALGALGADVLNIRGIISPGTYLDFLQTEYLRPSSPVITRTIHTMTGQDPLPDSI
ncbi:hypothetical protein [uncultured Faecalibaculum sp.]|uniref:hypothetical protein n=1 Tax=uncultured Faecalibaculum sp. TaxID=1729681 RepID=UPI00263599CF|nr:hypothetical protein [uncultured Faecalibaculum sp.]